MICLFLLLKVSLRKTGQIMVMKETKTLDKEAQKMFVKEVSNGWFLFDIIYRQLELSKVSQHEKEFHES